MDKIPSEILAQIVDSLAETYKWPKHPFQRKYSKYSKTKFAQYATISRVWKDSIEKLTLQDLTIKTDEFDAFAALFSGENISRRANLTSLAFDFTLPSPPSECCPVRQTIDRNMDSMVFSTSVAKLFTILADLATRANDLPPMSLSFSGAHRPSGYRCSKYISWSYPRSCGHSRREMLEAKAVSRYFELICENDIPVVDGVTSFELLDNTDLEDLKPSWIATLVDRLPSLETLQVMTRDVYEAGRHERIAQREGFVKFVCNLMGNSLRNVRLDVHHSPLENEHSPVHLFVDDGRWDGESWFRMFTHLATFPNLVVLQLLGGLVVCPQFFRCIADSCGTPFPSLVEFELQFAAETANGTWYHKRDDEVIESSRTDPEYEGWWEEEIMVQNSERRRRSYSRDAEDLAKVFGDGPFRTNVVRRLRFRSLPDETTFLPFLMDASRAVARLPHLRKFILRLGNWHGKHNDLEYSPIVSRVFELWFLKAGMHRSPPKSVSYYNPKVPGDAAYIDQNRLYWRVNGWKPWDEVQAAWNALAGQDAKTVFFEERFWTIRGNNPLHREYVGNF